MKKHFSNHLFFGLSILLICSSCEKEDELDAKDVAPAMVEAEMEGEFTSIDQFSYLGVQYSTTAEGGKMLGQNTFGCAVVSVDQTAKMITIDFGVGCLGQDGRTRRGKLFVHFTDRYFTSGAVITTTTEDFFVNDISVEGTRVVTNITQPDTSIPQFRVELTGGKITWLDGSFATREVLYTRKWDATDASDIKLIFDGVANGINREGFTYKSMIVTPLVFRAGCMGEGVNVPVRGSLIIEAKENYTIIVEYGLGVCDRSAVVTINSLSREITL